MSRARLRVSFIVSAARIPAFASKRRAIILTHRCELLIVRAHHPSVAFKILYYFSVTKQPPRPPLKAHSDLLDFSINRHLSTRTRPCVVPVLSSLFSFSFSPRRLPSTPHASLALAPGLTPSRRLPSIGIPCHRKLYRTPLTNGPRFALRGMLNGASKTPFALSRNKTNRHDCRRAFGSRMN